MQSERNFKFFSIKRTLKRNFTLLLINFVFNRTFSLWITVDFTTILQYFRKNKKNFARHTVVLNCTMLHKFFIRLSERKFCEHRRRTNLCKFRRTKKKKKKVFRYKVFFFLLCSCNIMTSSPLVKKQHRITNWTARFVN